MTADMDYCCRGECCGPGSWCCEHAGPHTHDDDPCVVGVDLSITATGLCDRRGRTSTVGGPSHEGDRRILTIVAAVSNAVLEEEPLPLHIAGEWDVSWVDLVVVEGLAIHGPGGAMAAAQLMGALKLDLIQQGVTYVEVPPSTLKKYATGKGNATKPDMAVALYKRTGLELANDNEVDAWWLRAAGLQALGHPIVDMPANQIEALNKVTWPKEPNT